MKINNKEVKVGDTIKGKPLSPELEAYADSIECNYWYYNDFANYLSQQHIKVILAEPHRIEIPRNNGMPSSPGSNVWNLNDDNYLKFFEIYQPFILPDDLFEI